MTSCENCLSISSVVAFPEGIEKVEREKKSMVEERRAREEVSEDRRDRRREIF